jgi:hypothetical protein
MSPVNESKDQIRNEIDSRYREYINGLLLFRFRVIFFLGIFLHLVFYYIDKLAYPASALTFLKIRCIDDFLLVILLGVSFIKKIKPYIVWLSDVAGTVIIVGMGMMVLLTDGSNSRYYEGANLVFLGFSGIANPFYIAHTIGTFLLWIGFFNLAMLTNHTQFNFLNFLFANYFMFSTALIVALMSKFYIDQHYNAFGNNKA